MSKHSIFLENINNLVQFCCIFTNTLKLMTFNNDKYKEIYENIQKFSSNNYKIVPKIIAVSKNQPISSVIDATEFGVRFFAENKVQEAKLKFGDLKKKI